MLVEGNERDIRVDICHILKTRYPATNTYIEKPNLISENFKSK